MKHIKIIILLILVTVTVNSQWLYNFNCGMPDTFDVPGTSLFGDGMTKPMSTLPLNNTDVYFRVLLVYVEFKNDNTGETTYWAPGEIPTYGNSLFASEKELGINAYEGKYLSNYFNKISNDKFDMIGDVKHITLPYEYTHYSSGNCYTEAMLDVMKMLDTNLNIDWRNYDLWSWNSSTQEFEMTSDGNIDMMYVQFRRADMCGMTSGGYGALYVDYSTLNYNKQINGCGLCYEGSGVMGINGWKMPIGAAIGYFRHEYCHYTLGNHRPYSTIAGGDGSQYALGYELGFAPQDLITVGLANVTTYDGDTHIFEIEDLQTTGDMLKIPTTNSGEYFLVSNRRRLAGDGPYTWDCNMAGDTAMGEPFKQYRDYSKGLYIYHITGGNNYEAMVDLECADGLWNWQHTGTSTPDWSISQTLAVLSKTAIGYNNDNPNTQYFGDGSRLTSRDGHSVISQNSNPYPGWSQNWFSIGKRHTDLNENGTDRIFTNIEELRCSRENMGDRWDAWAIDYNQVFSPYSSPNTKDIFNNHTGIFIVYDGLSGNTATVKVYQAAANTEDEDEILEATPPSKPMLFRPVEIYNCNGTSGNPRIIWDNNLEPDMVRNGLTTSYKRYKIYRAISTNPSIAPLTYTYHDTYDDYTPDDTANYIDNNIFNGAIIYCGLGGSNGNDTYYRYKIIAVDKYDDESVPSDFVSIKGHSIIPDRPVFNTEVTYSFSLSQNYPNPFNPATEIKFELPQNTFVTLVVYNAIGEEVARLVNNEYRNAGRYSVSFDGSKLASGIYFYSIVAGSYNEVKKMVLLK